MDTAPYILQKTKFVSTGVRSGWEGGSGDLQCHVCTQQEANNASREENKWSGHVYPQTVQMATMFLDEVRMQFVGGLRIRGLLRATQTNHGMIRLSQKGNAKNGRYEAESRNNNEYVPEAN